MKERVLVINPNSTEVSTSPWKGLTTGVHDVYANSTEQSFARPRFLYSSKARTTFD